MNDTDIFHELPSHELAFIKHLANTLISRKFSEHDKSLDVSEIDQEAFFEFCGRHCLLGLISTYLPHYEQSGLREDIIKKFKHGSKLYAARGLWMSAELKLIVQNLSKRKIPVAVLKGPLLSLEVYGSITERWSNDLDILIDVKDLPAAVSTLNNSDFYQDGNLQSANLLDYARYENALLLTNRQTGTRIDLHWNLLRHYLACNLDYRYYEDRLISKKFEGTTVKTICDEDLFIYMCCHAAKHGWERLEWLICIGVINGRTNEFAWAEVEEKAKKLGALKMVLLGCLLLREVGGVDIPGLMSESIDAYPDLIKSSKRIIDLQFSGFDNMPDSLSSRMNVFQLQIRDSILESLAYALRIFFHPTGQDYLVITWCKNYRCRQFLRPLRLLFQAVGLSKDTIE